MKKLLIILLLFTLTSCSYQPSNTVNYKDDMMIVYSASKVNEEYGIYKYYVMDNSKFGWTLNSDDKYNVGDTLIFKKK